jgi:radical SAM protein with 4Fe4S-binding SPASM domain
MENLSKKSIHIHGSERRDNVPTNILEKVVDKDPEQILQDQLYKRFGNRFLEYRKKYNTMLTDEKHKQYLDYPLSVVLELVNRCDLECVMCYQGFRNDTDKVTVDEKSLDKIFDDFKRNKLSALMLTASEPLLYKHIGKVLERAKDAEIMDIFLFTNGSLLNKKNSEMILNSSITRMFVSVDAATEETYNKIRIPVSKRLLETNRLEQLENKVKDFVQMRDSMNTKLPLTRVSFVALKENQHEIELFKNKWKGIVDSVEIQRETSIEVYDKLKSVEDGNKYQSSNTEYNCTKPWGDMSIYSDGSVGPCCNLVGRKTPIGNVNDNSIHEIWNGSAMNEIREGFKNNTPNDTCKICIDSQKVNI